MKRFHKTISFVDHLEPLLNSLTEHASSDVFFEFSQGLKKVALCSTEESCFPLKRSGLGTNQIASDYENESLEDSFCRILKEQDAKIKQVKKKEPVSIFLKHQYSQLLSVAEAKTVLDYLALVLFGLAKGVNYGYSSTSLSFFIAPNKEVVLCPDEVYLVATRCLLAHGLVKDTAASTVFSAIKASFVLGVFYQLFSPFLGTNYSWTASRTAFVSALPSPSEQLLCWLSWETLVMSTIELQFVNNSLRALAESPTPEPLEMIKAFSLKLGLHPSSQKGANFNLFLDECLPSWSVPIRWLETLQDLESFTGSIDEESVPAWSSTDGLVFRDLFLLGESFLLPVLRAMSLPF